MDLAEYRLSHTQEEIDDPEPPEWLVMGRDKNTGMASFTSDADRVDHIASIFPFMFFLVAALVALTTMTRMVDEERQLIGTYKALGYSRGRITGKYVGYVLLASVVGSVIGIAALGKLLPGVIMNAYAIMYYVPDPQAAHRPPASRCSPAGLAIGVTLIATWASVAATLREKPAALMLPRAPKAGKRILLERITPAVAAPVVLVEGDVPQPLPLQEALRHDAHRHRGLHGAAADGVGAARRHQRHHRHPVRRDHPPQRAHHARGQARRRSGAPSTSCSTDGRHRVVARRASTPETMLASGPRASDKRIDIVVPDDPEAFAQMKTLRTREGPRAAFDPGRHRAAQREDGKPARMNAIYANITHDTDTRSRLDEQLRASSAVKTLGYNDEVIDTYRTMLRSVDLIVVVLVVSAAALAFIVLYNLTNINIEERIREIATLKVLGFTRRETNAYIFREIALLAIIGAALGLVLGVFLEGFVVTTAEVDQVMFGRTIHPPSFVWGFVLTLVFSAASMLLMLPKLARIDMVESLKSNE